MKKTLLIFLMFAAIASQKSFAQASHVPGPAERKLTDSLCNCIVRIDKSKIKTSKEANDAFINCFGNQTGQLVEVAEERHTKIDDSKAMHEIGVDIGKDLLKQKCEGFLQLALIMNKKDDAELKATSEGEFKRIDSKGFNYIVLKDGNNLETSFLWLRQFAGSEKLMSGANQYAGRKVKINWQELEVYLPQVKGYYKVKEITSLEFE